MNINKKTIRLTESNLHKIIKESVKQILRENNILPNISEENILNIINTAISDENFEISDYNIHCDSRKSYHLKYDGALWLTFYTMDTTAVSTLVSFNAEYTPEEKASYDSPGCSDECNVWITSVDEIEIFINKETTPIQNDELKPKIFNIIDENLYEYLNDKVHDLILKEIEDYYDEMEGREYEYYDSLNEAYGIDIDDTLAWVQKKRPDLSPSAQYKFAQNIIKKRSRDSQLSTSSVKPNGYLIFGDNDTPNIPVMRIPFCYGHGRLEDDWGFDMFSIEKRFEKNMISKYEAKTGTYNCVYNGKPCILEIWLSKDLHKPSGLCYYADDYDAKQYVEDMKKHH